MEGIKFTDSKKITCEKTLIYLNKFRNVWNEHKAKWSAEYKLKYNKNIEGYPHLTKMFITDMNKSLTNESVNITEEKNL